MLRRAFLRRMALAAAACAFIDVPWPRAAKAEDVPGVVSGIQWSPDGQRWFAAESAGATMRLDGSVSIEVPGAHLEPRFFQFQWEGRTVEFETRPANVLAWAETDFATEPQGGIDWSFYRA